MLMLLLSKQKKLEPFNPGPITIDFVPLLRSGFFLPTLWSNVKGIEIPPSLGKAANLGVFRNIVRCTREKTVIE